MKPSTEIADPSTERSFDEIFHARWTPMVRLATLTTGSVALAEEVVQDAFIELYRRWTLVEEPSAWLRKAVINRCRDWIRRQTVERRHARPDENRLLLPDESLAIRDALTALTPRQRLAVVLRFYEDLSEAQIAEIIGCRRGTVKSLLSRGLSTLRQELDQ